MESNGSGGDNPQRFGGSGPPNRDTNPPIYLRVVNISKPEMAYISDGSGTRRLAILVPADQPINAGNMGASNVDSSNVNIGNQNLVNNYSTSGYEDPNPTMPNPELPSDNINYYPLPNEIQPYLLMTQPEYPTNYIVNPNVDRHNVPPPAVPHNLSGHLNNPNNYNAPEAPLGYNGNNFAYPIYVMNPSVANYEHSTGNYDPNAHNVALNNTYNNVSNRVDGYPPTSYMVPPPPTVPTINPIYAAPMERPPFLRPTTNRNIESGYSIPNPTRAHAPRCEPIPLTRMKKTDIPDETSHNMTGHFITNEEINRPPNNSFASVVTPIMTNLAAGYSVNNVLSNNYGMMSYTNANEISHPYPYMNIPAHHSYNSERVDATAYSNVVFEYNPHASHPHVPEMDSFDPNTYGEGDELGRR